MATHNSSSSFSILLAFRLKYGILAIDFERKFADEKLRNSEF